VEWGVGEEDEPGLGRAFFFFVLASQTQERPRLANERSEGRSGRVVMRSEEEEGEERKRA
jgi:hypothetical protein